MNYIENNIEPELNTSIKENFSISDEYTPPLFSENSENQITESESNNFKIEDQKLFEEEKDEDDFEIPAFLRKQKF